MFFLSSSASKERRRRNGAPNFRTYLSDTQDQVTFMRREPTARQMDVLLFIHKKAVCPSMREIAKHLGVTSNNGVNDHIQGLKARGLIENQEGVARSTRVTDAGLALLGVKRCPTCLGNGHIYPRRNETNSPADHPEVAAGSSNT